MKERGINVMADLEFDKIASVDGSYVKKNAAGKLEKYRFTLTDKRIITKGGKRLNRVLAELLAHIDNHVGKGGFNHHPLAVLGMPGFTANNFTDTDKQNIEDNAANLDDHTGKGGIDQHPLATGGKPGGQAGFSFVNFTEADKAAIHRAVNNLLAVEGDWRDWARFRARTTGFILRFI